MAALLAYSQAARPAPSGPRNVGEDAGHFSLVRSRAPLPSRVEGWQGCPAWRSPGMRRGWWGLKSQQV